MRSRDLRRGAVLGALALSILINGAATALLVRRMGGVRHLLDVSRPRERSGACAIGSVLPAFRCRDLQRPEERLLQVKLAQNTLAFIVRPNSVSAHRVVRLVNRLARRRRPPLPVVWIVVGDRPAGERFIRDAGIRQRALSCAPGALDLAERSLDSPLGLLVGAGEVIQARGVVDSAASLARFLESCAQPEVRTWLVETLYSDLAEFRDPLTHRAADQLDGTPAGAGARDPSSSSS